MKEWFSYEFGYVNVDPDNIYLTNTGNWSDTIDLREKNLWRSNSYKRTKAGIFLTLVTVVFLVLYLTNITSGNFGLLILIGLPVAGLSTYRYMKTELGASFRIPLSKIKQLEANDKEITIHFLDGRGDIDSETLSGIDKKGFIILEQLKILDTTAVKAHDQKTKSTP